MKKFLLTLSLVCFAQFGRTQLLTVENPYQSSFDQAYQLYPDIPKGLLEAIAYNQTRLTHLTPSMEASCTGMPQYLGVMGLIENGKSYFNENLKTISFHSGKSIELLKQNPNEEILAFALTYHKVLENNPAFATTVEEKLLLLEFMTEIPLHLNLEGNNYAFDAYLYGIIEFMNTAEMQSYYGFPNHKINGSKVFGHKRWEFLSSGKILIHSDHIENEKKDYYSNNNNGQQKSADYAPALWTAAASCNYSSRAGVLVSAVTIHTVQGSYAGCISWFQNCAASVSAHYVIRSSDGQVTQMVLEANKAWHVGSENPYTVGIEHEGYVNNPAWYTTAMYNSSAALSIDIADDHGINKIRTGWWPWLASTYYNSSAIPGSCVRIKGHMHFPNQSHSDPGINWDWDRYFKLIHPTPAANMVTTASGNFYDSGGAGADYTDDERTITTIAPPGATNVTVTFNNFNLEDTWDYLYIYDGADIDAPLIGYYTGTNNPGTVTSSGGSLTFEFRSDCNTLAAGWQAVFSSGSAPNTGDSIPPISSISISNIWQTMDFPAQFTDADEAGGSGLKKSFYHVSYFDGTGFYANNSRGFLRDEFDIATINPQWTLETGTWAMNSGVLEQSDETSSNTNLFASLTQDLSNVYVYEFSAAIGGSGINRRAGLHFFCDSAQLTNRGNSYFVWFRLDDQNVQIYKTVNDVFNLQQTDAISINADQWYNYKVIYDRTTGTIKVYRDNIIISQWTDPIPYTTGKYVSFRSGNSNYKVNNIKVYRSRYSNAPTTVTVGNCAGCDLQYQNPSPSTPAGSIYTFSNDSSDNLSSIVYEEVNVDWTAPDSLYYVNDISIFDEDTISNNNLAGGNWNIAADTHSDINRYYYCIGTTPGGNDVVDWYDNWFYTNFLDTINLITNQWYYISAKAENGAGLQSTATISDGFVYMTLGNPEQTIPTISIYPNPANQFIYLHGFTSNETYTLEWLDLKGSIIRSEILLVSGSDVMVNVPVGLSNSIYLLRLKSEKAIYNFKVEVVR